MHHRSTHCSRALELRSLDRETNRILLAQIQDRESFSAVGRGETTHRRALCRHRRDATLPSAP